MDEIMLKVDNVSKMFKLGQIGGTTLRDELQRFGAKLRHKEDPTQKIGAQTHTKNETFMALNGVSFEVKKGERVGIIGHNGAGKSTLLKLISRITAPTGGTISMNGRVASMLEVGTGFNGELTGRENIYMNGAILGMTKKEIDAKIEDIIEFSECRQFIDTPVKRYSSGMYVKLAFSVAAHLDSEIMIMDEVLAVGDMAFQKKCLDKMNEVSREEGRTILYVSHNMNTISQLCNRVIVLNHGKIIFDGNVNEGIELYNGVIKRFSSKIVVDRSMREIEPRNGVEITEVSIHSDIGIIGYGSSLNGEILIKNSSNVEKEFYLRLIVDDMYGNTVTAYRAQNKLKLAGNQIDKLSFSVDLSNVVPGMYNLSLVIYDNGISTLISWDILRNFSTITIEANDSFNHGLSWNSKYWGSIFNGYLQIN